jgi:hypothetical protein
MNRFVRSLTVVLVKCWCDENQNKRVINIFTSFPNLSSENMPLSDDNLQDHRADFMDAKVRVKFHLFETLLNKTDY